MNSPDRTSDTVRIRAIVRGVVQGVGFRAWTEKRARQMGVAGWVKNNSDGTVEAVIQGSQRAAHDLVSELQRGPAQARVDQVDIAYEAPDGACSEFGVRR